MKKLMMCNEAGCFYKAKYNGKCANHREDKLRVESSYHANRQVSPEWVRMVMEKLEEEQYTTL